MKVLVTGSRGMLGSSFVKSWKKQRPDVEVLGIGRADLDLTNRPAVQGFIGKYQPDAIIHAAARVDGIQAKINHPTTYLLENLLIDTSVISASIEAGVPELLYIGSAAIYPAECRQPLLESDVLSGFLEKPNEGYALAKIAGAKLCEYASSEFGLAYRTALPSNLYGPGDNFDPSTAHLLAATLAKVSAAKESGEDRVLIWGDGQARREFTFTEDLTAWLVTQIGHLSAWPAVLNLGYGYDYSINEYYEFAKEIIGFDGDFIHDTSKPTGVPRRLLDSSAAQKLGWTAPTGIKDGMRATYESMV